MTSNRVCFDVAFHVGQTSRSARDVHVPHGRRPVWRPAADLEVRPTKTSQVKTIYLGLGSNVGDRERNLSAAVERLSVFLKNLRLSPIYETEPIDYTGQRWFLNQVVEAETEIFPVQLLTRLQKIERELGRVRTIPNGPRTIDLDILLYGRSIVRSGQLEIPHPRMTDRRFVLAPLADLAPDLRHPITHRTVREMLDSAPAATVRLLHS